MAELRPDDYDQLASCYLDILRRRFSGKLPSTRSGANALAFRLFLSVKESAALDKLTAATNRTHRSR